MADVMVWVAAPVFICLGLSQVYATGIWQSYYQTLGSLGQNGVRLNGLVSLIIGGPIVILHNVWSGPPLLLTLFGWLLLLESAMCLVLPGAGLAGLSDIEDKTRGRVIRGTGIALIVIGGVLAVHAVTSVG